MKTSSLLLIIFCVIALLASCAPKPVEVTSFPSKLNINNLNVEFSDYKVNDYDLTIDICFVRPSQEPWLLDDISLKIDNQEISQKVAMQYGKTEIDQIRSDGYHCESILFAFEWSKVPTGKAELSIGKLKTDVDYEDWDCLKAQKNLDKAKTRIVISCDPAIVGRDSGFVVVKKPLFMKGTDAVLVAMDAFSDSVQTDWKFLFDIENP